MFGKALYLSAIVGSIAILTFLAGAFETPKTGAASAVPTATCDFVQKIEAAKSELLLTTKSGAWFRTHMTTTGHWLNAWKDLKAAECTAPSAPTNLRQASATETSITAQWGPSPPGNFLKPIGSTATTLTIAWGAAHDDAGIDHYTVTKPDGTVVGTTQTPQFPFPVPTGAVTFRVCVFATNSLGQNGNRNCGTYTKTV